MSAPRYHVAPAENGPYKYAVWDSEEKRDVAYTSDVLMCENYAAQMNEKGFIEP